MFSIILLIMATIACLPLVFAPADVGAPGSTVRAVNDVRELAVAIMVQQQALQAYHTANPAATGNVTTALVMPPPWLVPAGVVSVIGTSGTYVVGITYYDSTRYRYRAPNIAQALAEEQGYSGSIGITAAGTIASPQGGVVPLPAGVPAGVAGIAEVLD